MNQPRPYAVELARDRSERTFLVADDLLQPPIEFELSDFGDNLPPALDPKEPPSDLH